MMSQFIKHFVLLRTEQTEQKVRKYYQSRVRPILGLYGGLMLHTSPIQKASHVVFLNTPIVCFKDVYSTQNVM